MAFETPLASVVAFPEHRWRDWDGIVHAVEGAPAPDGGTLRWTVCGRYDIPAREPLMGPTDITCGACRIWGDAE